LNLETAAASRKIAQALDTLREFEKALTTNKMTTSFSSFSIHTIYAAHIFCVQLRFPGLINIGGAHVEGHTA